MVPELITAYTLISSDPNVKANAVYQTLQECRSHTIYNTYCNRIDFPADQLKNIGITQIIITNTTCMHPKKQNMHPKKQKSVIEDTSDILFLVSVSVALSMCISVIIATAITGI